MTGTKNKHAKHPSSHVERSQKVRLNITDERSNNADERSNNADGRSNSANRVAATVIENARIMKPVNKPTLRAIYL